MGVNTKRHLKGKLFRLYQGRARGTEIFSSLAEVFGTIKSKRPHDLTPRPFPFTGCIVFRHCVSALNSSCC